MLSETQSAPAITTIDRQAPIVETGEIEVEASPEDVWDLMAAIDQWPNWNPDVTWVSLSGELMEGATFRWKAGPGKITSTLQRVERPWFLAWTGATLGIKAVYVWRIAVQDGRTIVRTEESWGGLMARVFRGSLQRTLKQSIESGLEHLKNAVENRADLPVGGSTRS
jgi:hypothetical protein